MFFNKNKGFTLIELLVVVSIISLLSSVVLSNLNSARQSAQLVGLYQQLEQVEKSLILMRDDYSDWPLETTVTNSGSSNPPLDSIINDNVVTLSNYISEINTIRVNDENLVLEYDNDNDIHPVDTCQNNSNNFARGVNIIISNTGAFDDVLFDYLNDTFDIQENSSSNQIKNRCGKIRYNSSGAIIYSISNTP